MIWIKLWEFQGKILRGHVSCHCCSIPGPLGIRALPSLLEYRLQRGSFVLSFASYTMYSLAPTQHLVETKQMLVEWAITMLLVLSGTVWVKFPATSQNQIPSPMCWGINGKALCEWRAQGRHFHSPSTLFPNQGKREETWLERIWRWHLRSWHLETLELEDWVQKGVKWSYLILQSRANSLGSIEGP